MRTLAKAVRAGICVVLTATTAWGQGPAPAEPLPEPPLTEAVEQHRTADPVASDPDALVRIELEDGSVLRGTITGVAGEQYVIALVGGTTLTVPRSSVKEIVQERYAARPSTGEFWFADPNRTRYFYGPSAMMLRKGQAYFSQKELFFSSVGYGVTDNFSILAGTVAPLWITGTAGMNAILAAKAGAPVTENLHVAGGLEFLMLPAFGFGNEAQPIAGGFLFGSATWGQEGRHLTLSVGKPLLVAFGDGTVSSMDLIATLSGSIRMHRHIGLVTENWLVMTSVTEGDIGSAHAFGARFMLETIAADVGLVWIGVGGGSGFGMMPVPLPWVDFTWNFSLGDA